MSRSSRSAWTKRASGAAPRNGIYHASFNVPGLPHMEFTPLSKASRLRSALRISAKARETKMKEALAVDFTKRPRPEFDGSGSAT